MRFLLGRCLRGNPVSSCSSLSSMYCIGSALFSLEACLQKSPNWPFQLAAAAWPTCAFEGGKYAVRSFRVCYWVALLANSDLVEMLECVSKKELYCSTKQSSTHSVHRQLITKMGFARRCLQM